MVKRNTLQSYFMSPGFLAMAQDEKESNNKNDVSKKFMSDSEEL